MKIIEVAREQKDLLNEGIAYIAVWQQSLSNGKRSWFTEDFFPADSSEEEPIFETEQKARLAEIAALDGNAVLLNGYYHARIGSTDEPLSAASIADGLKWHYEQNNALVSGYLAEDKPAAQGEKEAASEIIAITIEVPFTGDPDILRALLQSKATLINAALGEDAVWYAPPDDYSPDNPGGWYGPAPRDNILPIEFIDDTVKFEWLRVGADSVEAWSAFLCAAVKFSQTTKRVTAKDTGLPESGKFAMRTFCLKIGLNNSTTDKAHRKTLMRFLSGDSAFATAESKERWLATHGSKKIKAEGNQ